MAKVEYHVVLDRDEWATVMTALEEYWRQTEELAKRNITPTARLTLAAEHGTATRLLRRLA
jgi:hypothetical protein